VLGQYAVQSKNECWLSGAVRVSVKVDRAKAVDLALLLSIACIGVGMVLNALWLIIAAAVVAGVLGVIVVLR
jgi:hypothetical protein